MLLLTIYSKVSNIGEMFGIPNNYPTFTFLTWLVTLYGIKISNTDLSITDKRSHTRYRNTGEKYQKSFEESYLVDWRRVMRHTSITSLMSIYVDSESRGIREILALACNIRMNK